VFSRLLFFSFFVLARRSARLSSLSYSFPFYNTDLIDVCNSPDLPATGIGFVDDANVLAFGKSTEETCSVLKEIHSCCLTWGTCMVLSLLHTNIFSFTSLRKNKICPPLSLNHLPLPFTLAPMPVF
jgi:hypothetical protein